MKHPHGSALKAFLLLFSLFLLGYFLSSRALRSELADLLAQPGEESTGLPEGGFGLSPSPAVRMIDATAPADITGEISDSRRNAIVVVAETVGPAVVSINVIQKQVLRGSSYISPFSGDLFDSFWREFFPPRVYERQIQSLGSGVIINEKGYVITNEHVTRGADAIKITLTDGREIDATLVGEDPGSDLALLRIEARDLPYALLGDSDDCIIGEWAIAIGNPFGYLLEDHQPTVTVGVISALHRDIKSKAETGRIYQDMIQTDASINPGNSGGPLVNARGEVIGINTFIFTESGGSLGIGFAIPINRTRKIIRDILEFGIPMDTWLGFMVQEITPSLAMSLKLPGTDGVLVSDIPPKLHITDGDEVLQIGDVVVSMNGKIVRTLNDWDKYLGQISRDEEVEIWVIREDRDFSMRVKGRIPPVEHNGRWFSLLNIKVSDINKRLRSKYQFRSHTGVVVTDANPPAAIVQAGMREGDVIKRVGNYKISNLKDFEYVFSLLKRGDTILIVFERNGQYMYFGFTI